MIRPFTCISLLLAAGSGLYLYTAKHDAQMQDREITRLSRQAQDGRTRAALLRAEYDRLGDPDRLRELATQVLTLQPTDPTQFTSMADLDRRLFAIGATVQPDPQPIAPPASEMSAKVPVVMASVPATTIAPAPAEKSFADKAPAEKPLADKPAPEKAVAMLTPPRIVPAPRPVAAAAVAVTTPTPSVLALAQQPAPRPPIIRQAAAAEIRPAPQRSVVAQAIPEPAHSQRPMKQDIAPPTSTPVVFKPPVFASALGMARSAVAPANLSIQGNDANLSSSAYTPPASGLARR